MSMNPAIYPELAKNQPIYYTQPLGVPSLYPVQSDNLNQPININAFVESDWNSSLCGCFDDFSEFFCALFCTPCYQINLYMKAEEPCCGCLFGGIVPLRTKIRTQRKIRGSVAGDYCTLYWCPICAMVQMGIELKRTSPLI